MEVPPLPAAEPSRLAHGLRALKSRNYRLFFGGQVVSLVGNFLTSTATSWLVYRLTGSELKLGLIAFVGQFPTFLVAPFAGVWVDRLPLRKTLVITQALAMVQSLGLAIAVFSGHATFGLLMVLAFLQGLINAFDIPARQAFVVQMLEDRRDLPNAIALNSSIVNGARLIGPSMAGLLIRLLGATGHGEGWCFAMDGVSYIGVILALLAMTLVPRVKVAQHPPVLHALKEGFAKSFGFAPIRNVLLLLSLVSLAGAPYITLMPVFAKQILHGDSLLYGILNGAAGFGALGGAIYLASRRTVVGISRALVAAATTFGITLVLFSFSRNAMLSVALMPIAGASMIIQMAGSNTLLQTLTEDEYRGRVMAMFAMCFMGTVPIGALITGGIAEHAGAPITVAAGGVICVVGAIFFNLSRAKLRPQVHEIYVRRGILPQVAVGLEEATLATDQAAG